MTSIEVLSTIISIISGLLGAAVSIKALIGSGKTQNDEERKGGDK